MIPTYEYVMLENIRRMFYCVSAFARFSYINVCAAVWVECHFFPQEREREAGSRNTVRVKVYDRNENLLLKHVNSITHATSVSQMVVNNKNNSTRSTTTLH